MRQTMTTAFLTFLVATNLAITTAFAQNSDGDSPAARIARAQMLADVEHDFVAAAAVLKQLAESERVPAEDRTKAWLALAEVHKKTGESEAATAALARAANGTGPAAEKAKARQATATADAVQIYEMLAKLKRGVGVGNDMVWIGRPVVAPTIEWIDREVVDLGFVSSATEVLLRIGSDEVKQWLANLRDRYDPLKRRAVVRAFRSGKGMAADLSMFLADPDPEVVRDVLHLSPWVASREQMLALARSSNSMIAEAAFMQLEQWQLLRGEDSIEVRRALLDFLVAKIEAGQDVHECRERLRYVSRGFDSAEARELWLATLVPSGGYMLADPGSFESGVDAHIESSLRVARALGPFVPKSNMPHARITQVLRSFIDTASEKWSRAAMSAMLELADLGYVSKDKALVDYMDRVATSEDWVIHIDRLTDPWDLKRAQNLAADSETVPAMQRMILRSLNTPPEELSGRATVEGLLDRLAVNPDPQRAGWIAEFVETGLDGTTFGRTAEEKRVETLRYKALVLLYEMDPRIARDGLVRIAGYPAERPNSRGYRHHALLRLAALGDPSTIDAFVAECRSLPTPDPDPDNGILHELADDWIGRRPESHDPEFIARIFDACLATGRIDLWDQLAAGRSSRRGGNVSEYDWDRTPLPIARAIAKNVRHAPENRRSSILNEVFKHPDAKQLEPLMVACLRDEVDGVRSAAAQAVRQQFYGDERLVAWLTPLLGDASPYVTELAIEGIATTWRKDKAKVIELVEPMLRHESARVRAEALDVLWGADADNAVEHALKLEKDEETVVRRKVIEVASDTLDRRLAPVLISYLPNKYHRDEAQKVLDSIRYYNDEKERWRRILDGSGLGAQSAAEALVKQATTGATIDIRVLAIESLGTLGVPETLPLLINWSTDAEPRIAAAARAAIAKINGAKKPQK